MADILALPDARLAIGLPVDDTSEDDDLTATYVPAVTPIVEDLIGPVITSAGRILNADGGSASVLLPSAVYSIDNLFEDQVPLTEGTDFVVNYTAGIIIRGTSGTATWAAGVQNIAVFYTAGAFTDPTDVPADIKLCARIILAHLWQNDRGGYRPEFGSPDDDVVTTPSGFAVPRRAVEAVTGRLLSLGFA